MTFTERQLRSAQASRALFTSAAVILTALALMHLADGARVLAAMSGFPAALFAMSALLTTHRIGIMKRAVARDEFRGRMAASPFLALPPPVPALRSAWDVSMTLSPAAPWNDVCHYEDASRKPDGIAHGVIRVIPRTAVRPWSLGAPVVTSWTVVTRAPSRGEGTGLLKAAEPMLRERLADLADARARYFRLAGGVLFEVLNGPACDAETGERLAAYTVAQAAAPKAAVTQPDSGAVKLDPRWEWELVRRLGMPDEYVKVRCLHTDVVEVESDGKVVAQLCRACDTRFPAPVSGPADDWPESLRKPPGAR